MPRARRLQRGPGDPSLLLDFTSTPSCHSLTLLYHTGKRRSLSLGAQLSLGHSFLLCRGSRRRPAPASGRRGAASGTAQAPASVLSFV